jgi:hypothetical protein
MSDAWICLLSFVSVCILLITQCLSDQKPVVAALFLTVYGNMYEVFQKSIFFYSSWSSVITYRTLKLVLKPAPLSSLRAWTLHLTQNTSWLGCVVCDRIRFVKYCMEYTLPVFFFFFLFLSLKTSKAQVDLPACWYHYSHISRSGFPIRSPPLWGYVWRFRALYGNSYRENIFKMFFLFLSHNFL